MKATQSGALTATPKAIAKAEKKIIPSIVVKAPRAAHVVISPFHVKLFNCAFKAADAANKAHMSQRAAMCAMLKTQYGATKPTFDQFRGDRDALRILALGRGLVDDQWVRKPYNAALIELYGALPVSMSPAAIAKRAQRPTHGKGGKKAGAKKGATTTRRESEPETIGQFIAKHGPAAVLLELSRILATARESELDAKTLQALAAHYKK